MSTLTITVPCAAEPFPYLFCLIYGGDGDCGELCTTYNPGGCNT